MRLPFIASVLASSAAALFGVLSLAVVACNEAPLIPARDAGDPCLAPQLESPCKAQSTTLPGCGPDLNSLEALTREVVLDGGSYPPGCAAIVYSAVPDSDNQCTQLGSCHCQNAGDDASATSYVWLCQQ